MDAPKQTFHVSPEENYRPTQIDLYEQRPRARELALFGIPHMVILDELDNICTDVVVMKAEDKVLDVHPIDDKLGPSEMICLRVRKSASHLRFW